ncbi:MAG: helix-turn-helix domain-containing protein [Flavobacteriaceae bacterium]
MKLYNTIVLTVKIIVHFGYPIVTLLILKTEIEKQKIERSDDYASKLKWIKIVAYLLLISASLLVLHVTTTTTFNIPFNKQIDIIRFIIITIIIGYFGLKFGVFFSVVNEIKKTGKSYKHSPLKEEEKKNVKAKINAFFLISNEYLETTFSLDTLSKVLDIPKHYLSEIISTELDSSFYELVNSNRVQYAQKKIKDTDSENLTLEAIGYESGFNSKSAFFRHFKKYTGKTPRQYKLEISTN